MVEPADEGREYRCDKGHRTTFYDEHVPDACEYRGEHQWDWFGALCGAPCREVKPDA